MEESKAIQLIDDYLTGNLSEEDLLLLKEARANKNPLFEDLDVSKAVFSGLRVNHKNTLKSEFSDMLKEVQQDSKPARRIRPIYYRIAASLLIFKSL